MKRALGFAFAVSISMVGLAVTAGAVLQACDSYVCKYKGHDYHVGDTWTDGCLSCRCPPEGAKSAWCNYPACADAGADADGSGQ